MTHVIQGFTQFYLPPNMGYTCLYHPAAENHRPLAGTHCAYPCRDGQSELTQVVGQTEINFPHWQLNPDVVTHSLIPVLPGSNCRESLHFGRYSQRDDQSELTQVMGQININFSHRESNPDMVTHPSTNWVQRIYLLTCLFLLQAVKLTSVKAQLPYEYYSLHICKPKKITYKSENLGIYSVLY